VVRLINTVELDYRLAHGTFADWNELYQSGAIGAAEALAGCDWPRIGARTGSGAWLVPSNSSLATGKVIKCLCATSTTSNVGFRFLAIQAGLSTKEM